MFPPLDWAELEELIPFLDPGKKIVIGESATRLCEGEPLTHSHILPLLSSLRARFPQASLQLTTNGTLLTQNMMAKLAGLTGINSRGDPLLELVISLNCATPEIRSQILGDEEPQRVLKGLEYCRYYEVPFHGSVVAVPHLTGWDELRHTLHLLDSVGARTIRLFLPGLTRFTREGNQDSFAIWDEVARVGQAMKSELGCPVLLEPPLKKDLLARVEGVIKGTGAEEAGLREGDVITAVNRVSICSAMSAFERIKESLNPRLTVFRSVERGDEQPSISFSDSEELELTVRKERDAPPGLVLSRDLAVETMESVRGEIERHRASSTILLTSRAAAPLWQAAVCGGLVPPQTRISIVQNKFFGGTICSAGLLTISDLKEHLNDLAWQEPPDLILLPDTPFDSRGTDLRGEHFGELLQSFPQFKMVLLPG